MSVSVSPYPRFKAFYPATGTPLSAGQLYTAQPGTTVQFGIPPAYPMPTFTDSTGQTQNNNPVTLDASGEADVWLSGYTKLVLFDANGNLVWSKDNVSSQAAIQATTLQWVPQSAPTYIDATHFSVPGNQTATFLPGTAVQATITGGVIQGIIQSASYGGTPVITTVTVAWFSTQLNASLSAVSIGIVAGGVPGSAPVMPVQQYSANMTPTYANLFQAWEANSANATTFTLPNANSVPPGSWYDVFNIGSNVTTVVGTINGIANLTIPPWTGARITSDGANWTIPNRLLAMQSVTANKTANSADLFQSFVANSANAISFTLPAANSVPLGSYLELVNAGNTALTLVGTVNNSANLTFTSYTGGRLISDGTNWWNSGGGPTAPTVSKSANYTLLFTDLYRQFMASNAANLTLPLANAVPDGSWYDIFNTGASNATVVGTINGQPNLALTQNTGKRIFSANGSWYAK